MHIFRLVGKSPFSVSTLARPRFLGCTRYCRSNDGACDMAPGEIHFPGCFGNPRPAPLFPRAITIAKSNFSARLETPTGKQQPPPELLEHRHFRGRTIAVPRSLRAHSRSPGLVCSHPAIQHRSFPSSFYSQHRLPAPSKR